MGVLDIEIDRSLLKDIANKGNYVNYPACILMNNSMQSLNSYTYNWIVNLDDIDGERLDIVSSYKNKPDAFRLNKFTLTTGKTYVISCNIKTSNGDVLSGTEP